ncbi:MAG TPA: tRNA guanosine(15) transglycosylase TgtA [Candidatus Saccharimonadales bacterium]|nr:tRNA guanosine(15) transglycosylase TgtA [Candidatus Saccharimonadales bacterium]
MSFEIRNKDLLGRIGLLRTKSGTVETPLLLPVVNPNHQLISANDLRGSFGFDAVITNSYLVWRRFRKEQTVPKIHDLLNFDGIIATDSGAYQILRYGDVEVQPNDIIRFQEQLESDIAVILDIPTDQAVSRTKAKWTVEETLRRADDALRIIQRRDILWVGPVQGGVFADLVAESAKEMTKRSFSIHALGSPTTVMQQYHYDVLVDMIMAAKLNLPPDRPLHLFGAGHPMMFALAIALGCDIFDSASYAIFARNGRYLTAHGTAKIEDLEFFPCNCSSCHGKKPYEIRRLLPLERERFLAAHNLHVCSSELQTAKQALTEGRLWELVESRSYSHPSLRRSFQQMLKYAKSIERETPIRKSKGPLIISYDSLRRPEILRHQNRLITNYTIPSRAKTGILLPERYLEPFREDPQQDRPIDKISKRMDLHCSTYGLAYGVIPEEILDVYPLSQSENSLDPDANTIRDSVDRIVKFLSHTNYRSCVILTEEQWQRRLAISVQRKLRKKLKVKIIEAENLDQSIITEIFSFSKPKRRKRMK